MRLAGGKVEGCSCPDHQRRGVTCKHMAACIIQARAWARVERAEVEGTLGTLYGQTIIRLTLASGWEAGALACLLDTIQLAEGRRCAAPAVVTFPTHRAPLALAA